MARRTYSIRLKLLIGLAIAIALATAVEAGVAYHIALHEVDAISDYHMVQLAHAVRRGLPGSVPVSIHDDLIGGVDHSLSLLVRNRVITEPEPPQSAAQAEESYFTIRKVGQVDYRVFTIHGRVKDIEVFQDLSARGGYATHLALRTVAPIIAMTPLLLLLVWLGISRALCPLVNSRKEIAQRAPGDLHALRTEGVPEELLPFINEINVLFERISQAFAAQKSFVGYAAHELRSPLTALRLQVQSMQRAPTQEARQVAAERLMSGIDRATRLVEQMLVLAREEATARSDTHTTLAAIVRLALSDVLPLLQARHIDISAELPESDDDQAFSIAGDIEALRILLRNLVENAGKYAPEQGSVRILARLESGSPVLCIEDNGPGIPPEEYERAFERFRRGNTHGADGSGLGLAIVKAIADRHHIRISLGRSVSLGGLAVTLTFPSCQPPAVRKPR